MKAKDDNIALGPSSNCGVKVPKDYVALSTPDEGYILVPESEYKTQGKSAILDKYDSKF